MRKKLKQSSSSSNFWVGLATLGSAAVTAVITVLTSDPEAIKTMTLTTFSTTILMQMSNILYHLNKNTAIPTQGLAGPHTQGGTNLDTQ